MLGSLLLVLQIAAVGQASGSVDRPLTDLSPPPRDTVAAVAPARAPRAPDGRQFRIVVDAGHGGTDPGMKGPTTRHGAFREKDVTLAVSRRVQEELLRRGALVTMTRTRDTLIALADRGRIANRVRGDLFVSIHVNAANPTWANPAGARGFETFFLAEAKTEDARRVERMENEAVRFETPDPHAVATDGLEFILNDMAQNEHLRESSELAELIQHELAAHHPGPNRGVKQAGFAVLVRSFMPAVLVEIGFGTNPAEAHWLQTPDVQDQIARAVSDGIMTYLSRYAERLRRACAASAASAECG